MPIDTAHLRHRVDSVRDDAAGKAVVREALDRYDALVDVADPTAQDITPLVLAATSRFALVWPVGADLLLDLARRSHAALDAVLAIVAHGTAAERFQLIASLDRHVPTDLATELVRFAVHDRSSKVRVKAAERIDHLGLDLVDELREQVRIETHRVARTSLEMHLAMATVGYQVTHDDAGNAKVWFRSAHGGWTGFRMTSQEVAAGRLQERLEAVRERQRRIFS